MLNEYARTQGCPLVLLRVNIEFWIGADMTVPLLFESTEGLGLGLAFI